MYSVNSELIGPELGFFCDKESAHSCSSECTYPPPPSEEGSNHRDTEKKTSLQWDYFLHVVKQDLRSATEAGGDLLTISQSRNYISSSYEIKNTSLQTVQ